MIFSKVSFKSSTFCINQKIFKCFIPIKTGYCFFNIFSICLAVIPYFADIMWWEGYTNVNLTKNIIVMAFFKYRDINSVFRNYICISTKYKIDAWHRVIYNMSRLISNLWISSWWCVRQSGSWPTELIISFFHRFKPRALKSPKIIEQIQISSFKFLRSKSKFTQKFSNSSLFWLGERYIQVKIHFSLCERISVTKQLSKVQTSSHLIRGICSL